jgi:hypothetical protein
MVYSRPEEEGRALAYVGSIFFSLGLAVLAALTFGFRAVVRSLRKSWAATWPTVSGQITTCDVKAIHGRFLDYALGVIGYSYQIDDDYYSGYLTRQLWDEQQAWTFVDACKDKSVLVHCKPGKPQVSVLREIDPTGVLAIRQRRFESPHYRFGPVLAILWALRNVSDWAENRLHKEAQNWPSVSGTVEYAEPMMGGDDSDAHWGSDLHYSYSVDGKSYSASYYFRASSEEDARELVKGWRNREILVHYFPANPARSVFVPQDETPVLSAEP